jgi:hypothetical protein
MKKQLKNILFISDDFSGGSFAILKEVCELGNFYYHPKNNCFRFKFTLINDFSIPTNRFHAILIDYGILGNHYDALQKLERLYNKGVVLIWCGGLHRISNDDAKETFPEQDFLHNLRHCGLSRDDVLFCLYKTLKEVKGKDIRNSSQP